jgi:zinc protease
MIEFEKFQLPNGLNVVVHEDHRTPLVAVDILYHVGSKNERWGRTGFAHLFEHLMFEGSKNAPGKTFDQVLQNIGADNNAYTSEDITNYYEILPGHELEAALWLESDRMRFLNINQEMLDTQRDVVMEERRQRVDNQPYGTAMEKLAQHAYQVHPYRWPVIGYMDHLLEASVEDVQTFYNTYYAPNNATLILAGDITPAKAKELTDKYFGEFKSSGEIARPTEVEPSQSGEKRETVYESVQLPALFIGYHSVAENHPDYPVFDLLSDILSSGKSSRMYQELVYEKRKAQMISAFQEQNEHPGLFVVYSIARPGIQIDDLEKEVYAQFEKIESNGVTDYELQKVKNMVMANFISRFQGVGNKADFIARYAGMYGKPELINEIMSRYEKVTADDIQRVVKSYFRPDNRVVLHYLPK